MSKIEKLPPLTNEFVVPSEHLKHMIQYFQVFHYNERNKEAFFRVFPEGSAGLVYSYGNSHYEMTTEFEHKRDHIYLKGQFDHYTLYKSIGKTNLIIVKFTPIGGYLLLKQDMKELLNQTLDLKKFLKHEYADLINDLKETVTDKEKVKVFEDFLNENSLPRFDGMEDIQKIIEIMNVEKGKVTIPDLADAVKMSVSSLEKKFNKYIGFNPKTYCRIQTMKDFFAKQKEDPDKNLYDLALECGYHDQSHFIKDFKKFTGTSPKKYLKNIEIMGFKSIKS